MKVGLRTTVAVLVAALNATVFAVGFVLLSGQITDWNEELGAEYESNTLDQLEALVDERGNLQVARILRWPGWRSFEDAVVASTPVERNGSFEVRGAHLAIHGSALRGPRFPEQAILGDIHAACASGRRLETERGVAVPVRYPNGEVWGGCWILRTPRAGLGPMVVKLLPWFALSTLLLTLVTFGAVRWLVLDPVRRLATAAQRLRLGDLDARVGDTARDDELGQLMRTFDGMAAEVQGFQATLEKEVDEATRQARAAEAAAMTQRRLASTGELAAGVAHEINNPLGGMMNAVEALGDPELAPRRRGQYLELVQGGLERMRQTVGRLLRLAPRETRPERVAPRGPMEDAIGLVQHRADRLGVTLHVGREGNPRDTREPDAYAELEELPALHGHSGELGQALLNLLGNALDAIEESRAAGGPGSRVELLAEVREDTLVWMVRDDGPGASAETLERAAHAFFTTKDPGKGTGLGLAIVHSTVVGHGGRLTLSSDGGFQATVSLPVAPAEGEQA